MIKINDKKYDISGKTIEDVYQKIFKESSKGKPPKVGSPLYNDSFKSKEDAEEYSYENAYLPL
jgi:hypothetical protein